MRSIVPGEVFTWSVARFGVSTAATHAVAVTANGSTRLTLGMAFSVLFGPLLWLLAGSLTRQHVSQEALALKAMVERDLHGFGGASGLPVASQWGRAGGSWRQLRVELSQ